MLATSLSLTAALRTAGCVFAEDEAALLLGAARSPDDLARMLARRLAGEPLEHVVGWASFHGLRIAVGPGVFVPRLRTEFLAQESISRLAPASVVLDLCCGSGAVGAALLATEPGLELHATDIDPAAVACARRNLPHARVYEGDLLAPVPRSVQGRVDLLLASTPYVPTEAIRLLPPEARLHEPWVALDGGEDGLDVVRRILTEGPKWLSPLGSLLLETSERQAPQVLRTARRLGLRARTRRCDDRDATVVIMWREACAGR